MVNSRIRGMPELPSVTPAAAPTVHAVKPARLFALVPCAGSGSRSGAVRPKQYVTLAGKAMVAHTLEALLAVARIDAVLVVLSPDDAGFAEAVPGFASSRGWCCHTGGATRAATVANGLNELRRRGAHDTDWVLVHDAARCLLQPAWVDTLIDACLPGPGEPAEGDEAVGGLLAIPVADTLKREAQGRVQQTLDRRHTWAAQTPQMFRIGMLAEALVQAGTAVTDESSAIEAMGHQPRLVEAPAENFKVTWPADFALAERLLRTR
jgi:2-C-methyl-D-erythritol 4-phosphate cytidylyltransferase